MDFTFDFLEELDSELVQLGRDIERIFYDDPHGVLVKSRLFAEHMTKQVAMLEERDELKYVKQVERVNLLDREGLFTREVAQAFDAIRTIGNRAVHENGKGDLEIALKIHKNLFKISVWFMEVYGSYDFQTPTYKHPAIRKNEGMDSERINELIESTLSKQLTNFLKQEGREADILPQKESDNETEVEKHMGEEKIPQADEGIEKGMETTEEDDERRLHGSHLLYQFSKLRESSQEAVEGFNTFSGFKKYLHVKRPIQEDLVDTMEKAQNETGSQLIFLCGSVGDGKSHLLAYMNQFRPDLTNIFQIHNDATESFDPQKNSLDTLSEVLEPFSDEKINQTNEKMILAINLGVLHNFLESNYVKESYTKLAAFIADSGVFDTDYVSEPYSEDHFNLISFTDYHPYQLTETGPKSDYFLELFEKIIRPTTANPFYSAYTADEKEKTTGPFMTNYRLLQQEKVREKLSQLLVKAIVQYKYILSTRALLNFIHDIIVPADIEEYLVSTTVIEDTNMLLPNILFNSADRSPLLKVIRELDPIHHRSEKTDEILVELNNAIEISEVFQRHIRLDGLGEWREALADMGAFYELTQSTKQLLNASLIRLSYFLAEDLQTIFENETYNKFMKHLYAFNIGIPALLKEVYQETEEAVFAWKGGPKQHSSYVYFEETMGSMNMAQALNIRRYTNHLVKRNQQVFKRFKNTLLIGFQDNNKMKHVLLEIDYPLYETMLKVLKGYRPNKKDKEDAIQFLEFIDKLMEIGRKEDEIVVYDSVDDLLFKLEYDEDFEEFSFKRE